MKLNAKSGLRARTTALTVLDGTDLAERQAVLPTSSKYTRVHLDAGILSATLFIERSLVRPVK